MKKIKKILLLILTYAFAIFMVNGGIKHFTTPEPYIQMVPTWLIFREFIVAASGIVEILLGAMLFLRGKIATLASALLLLMMLCFLPLHIADLFLESPRIAAFFPADADMHSVVWIRVGMQFLFILWSYVVFRFQREKNGCPIKCHAKK